jgi:hypothetical protein
LIFILFLFYFSVVLQDLKSDKDLKDSLAPSVESEHSVSESLLLKLKKIQKRKDNIGDEDL